MSYLKSYLFSTWLHNTEILLLHGAAKFLELPAVELLETIFLQMILLSPFVACHLQYTPVPSNTSRIRGSRYGDVSIIGHMG